MGLLHKLQSPLGMTVAKDFDVSSGSAVGWSEAAVVTPLKGTWVVVEQAEPLAPPKGPGGA